MEGYKVMGAIMAGIVLTLLFAMIGCYFLAGV
jgi:hypothetical protein